MSWDRHRYRYYGYGIPEGMQSSLGATAINQQCFIRKEHKCGKMFGASKSCFIACPTDDDLEPILGLMSEKLSKLGIEPIIAVKERAYGQDIFCTKICGKIIESRFCIVILDDTLKGRTHIPNPNVYYEYGLMTALRKHIIPLQKDSWDLAFNIQSYDTIKYNSKNIAAELDRGIRDAIKVAEAKEPERAVGTLTDKYIMRRMELSGFDAKDEKWFLAEVIEDTGFRGFGHNEKRFYAYLGKLSGEEDLQAYLDDISIIVYRTEKKAKEMEQELSRLKRSMEVLAKQEAQELQTRGTIVRRGEYPPVTVTSLRSRMAEAEDRLKLMSVVFIGFVVSSGVDVSDFLSSAESMLKTNPRFKVTCSHDGRIDFDSVTVDVSMVQE